MKQYLLPNLVAATLLTTPFCLAAQTESCDLAIVRAISPQASPKETQSVNFLVTNLSGTAVESFSASVSKNGESVSEEIISPEERLFPGDTITVTLTSPVNLEYGFTDSIEISVVPISIEDIDTSNNCLSYEVSMPWLMEFPYTWTDENAPTDFYASEPWIFSPDGTFHFMGTKPSLTEPVTSGVFEFEDKQDVKCSFVYNCSDTACITLYAFNGEEEAMLSSVTLPGNGADYTESMLFGSVYGAVQFRIRVTFPERPTSYVVFNISNVNFEPSIPDLHAEAILAPAATKIATGDPVTVKARFINKSASDIVNPDFYYNAGGDDVKETYNGTIGCGETLDFTFLTTYTVEEATHQIVKVWCEAQEDTNPQNDEVRTHEITYYAPLDFPYHTEFDSDTDLWSIIDANENEWVWAFGALEDGNNILGFPAAYGTYDDYAVSPAINLPDGKVRLSFYYSGISGGSHLTVLAGTTPEPAEMTEILFDRDVDQYGWRQGYALFDVEEAGNHYLAFHITGSQDQLLIDKLSLDNNDDLCIGNVRFDTSSGFNKTSANVMLSLMNHGINEQKDIVVEYSVNGGSPVAETIPGPIMPGDTIHHIFAEPFDISTSGTTYFVKGNIVSEIGSDRFNDQTEGTPITHYENKTVPYYNDFCDASRAEQWSTLSSSSQAAWNIIVAEGDYFNTNGGYDGSGSLKFTNKGYDNNDAWAFSECLKLESGTYELSFFYRTAPTWDFDSYRQNFEVLAGKEANPEAMTTEIAKFEDILVNGITYNKFNSLITIEEEGYYYIGFHAFGEKRSGHIQIDALSVETHTSGRELPYQSDFAENSEEWYRYNPNSAFSQWKYNEETGAMQVVCMENADNHTEGMLVSPKLMIEADDTAKITVEYGVESDNNDIRLGIYVSENNNPDDFELLAEYGAASSGFPIEIELDAIGTDRPLYIGFRSNSDYNNDLFLANGYTLSLYSVAVDGTTVKVDTISSGEAELWRREGNAVISSDPEAAIVIHDALGRIVARGCGYVEISKLSGIYVVSIETRKGIETFKTVL